MTDVSPREALTGAVRYWEPRRPIYNLVLLVVVLLNYYFHLPISRAALRFSTLEVLDHYSSACGLPIPPPPHPCLLRGLPFSGRSGDVRGPQEKWLRIAMDAKKNSLDRPPFLFRLWRHIGGHSLTHTACSGAVT